MKPKFKKLTKTIVFILIPILLWNCATEEIGVKNNEATTKTFLEEINQAKLSLDELKKDPKINTILNDALKGIKQNNPYQKNQNNPQKIELSNAVTKFSRLDYTSYTIPIINSIQNITSFQNMVIETDDVREAAYLITYYPNNNYQKAKNAQNINEDQTIYYMASSKIEYLYYKRKINTFPNNPSTKKTVSSTNPLIEESLVICVITYTPGHNCTAGPDHQFGDDSCNAGPGQIATGPVVSESCTNIPEAPPTFPNDPPGGGGIGPDDSSYGSGGGMILLPIDPLADYPKKWICMNPPSCTELIPYTPILTIPMDDPYNFYTGILSYDQITTILRFEYSDVKNAIDDFLLENQNENGSYNTDVTDMVGETINAFMNGIEVDSGVSDFVDEQPVKIYMGTVSDFKSLLDNSPRGVGKFKGSEAGNYLKSLGETKFNFKQMRPLPTYTGFFNTKKSRYIYTKKGGWIDKAHFMFYAGKAYQYKINNVTNPIGEAVQDGYKQEASDGIVARHSAYSYEDLPSDKFGAEFAVNFFDINSSLTFSEQLANYLNNILNASSPNDAPNFNDTPDLDSKDTRPITNTTTTPIYTK